MAPDGSRIAVGSYEKHGSLAVQDLAALELREVLQTPDRRFSGPLVLFDLPASTVTRFPTLTDVSIVAFAPDSRQFAVQQGGALSVVDLTGQRLRELRLPPDYVLDSDTSWSPDGELLTISHGYDAKLAFL